MLCGPQKDLYSHNGNRPRLTCAFQESSRPVFSRSFRVQQSRECCDGTLPCNVSPVPMEIPQTALKSWTLMPSPTPIRWVFSSHSIGCSVYMSRVSDVHAGGLHSRAAAVHIPVRSAHPRYGRVMGNSFEPSPRRDWPMSSPGNTIIITLMRFMPLTTFLQATRIAFTTFVRK